jgi:hypothetical protein
MLGGEPCALPALQETSTDPDLGKFGFAKAPAASQDFVAMRVSIFNCVMADLTRLVTRDILGAYDFSVFLT